MDDKPISAFEVLEPEELSETTLKELGVDQPDGFKIIVLAFM